MKATVLGCGSSGGVPRFGGIDGSGDWGSCDPNNPKNRRLRCALLLSQTNDAGTTTLCIDAGPDFRAQMLDAGVLMLDALLLTHEHADHIHGIDDMRQFVTIKTFEKMDKLRADPNVEISRETYFDLVEQSRIDCFAGLSCYSAMQERFGYLFTAEEGSLYPPIMRLQQIHAPFNIIGEGGNMHVEPFAVPHGSIDAYGFKINGLVYLPDVKELTAQAKEMIQGCDTLIIDCLQFKTHSTHADYTTTLEWIEELKPTRAILTNLHSSMDYESLVNMTPAHITPAFDGMQIDC